MLMNLLFMYTTSKPVLFLILSLLFSVAINAQVPTDLYVFELHKAGSTYHIYQPKFLSGFNPGGYTNQPWFTPEGDLLVSVRWLDENQNDIYQLSLNDSRIRRLTHTTSNEYSPRFDPTNEYLSVVRQVEGDIMDQQVCMARLSGGVFRSVTPDRKDVGYYTWIDKDQLGLFRIDGESSKLEKYNIVNQQARKITSVVGRTLWTNAYGSIVYVHRFSNDYWYLKKYNSDAFSMDIIMQTPGMTEDFALASDGTYFMGFEGKLFCYHPDRNTSWQQMADLTIYGIEQVTRLAVSPDGSKLALVSTKINE